MSDEQMAEVVRNQVRHIRESHAIDRRGWTPQQWIDDARRLMGDLDGSVADLVNGHVLRLLAALAEKDAKISARDIEIERLRKQVLRMTDAVGERDARIDAALGDTP